MSGICGIIEAPQKKVAEDHLAAMIRCLAHRGPDAQKTWSGQSAALGQLMLYTTTESLHEDLPWCHSESGLVITADLRIDNRQELLDALELKSEPDRIVPDSRIVLFAFLKWGKACVEKLSGDFIFAIWNPSEHSLFCARDHFGMRPFYYHHSGERFVFASSAIAVALALDSPYSLNEGRVADYLLRESEGINKTETFFKEIYRLPAASQLSFCRGKLSIQSYWATESLTELELGSDDDYMDAFREVFSRSVSRCLRAHRPVACMLSGGVDSSSIVGMAVKLRATGNTSGAGYLSRTVSQISDDETGCSESACIRAVVEHCGLDAVLRRSDIVEEHARQIGAWLETLEDPFDSSMIQRFLMHLSAAEIGHRVVLDGVDGDMIASLPAGYPAFLAVNGQLGSAFREAFLQRKNFHNRQTSVLRPIAGALWPLITYKSLREKRRSQAQKRFLAAEMKLNLIRPEFAEAVGLEQRFERYSSTLHRCNLEHNRSSGLRAARVERVRVPYLTAAIERYERVAAVGGVEARHPLLDRELTEFCLRLPWDQSCRNGWSKYGLRRLAAEVVPHQIAWRRDYGGLDWQYQARWLNGNRQMIIDQLMSDSGQLSEWIDWPMFSKRLQRDKIERDEMIDYISGRLVCLKLWMCRHFQ